MGIRVRAVTRRHESLREEYPPDARRQVAASFPVLGPRRAAEDARPGETAGAVHGTGRRVPEARVVQAATRARAVAGHPAAKRQTTTGRDQPKNHEVRSAAEA